MKSFGKNLKEEMKISKINQAKLAELLKITQQQISLYCTGKSQPNFDTFIQICHILHTTPNEMLDFAE